jgi:hypothetical protein
MLVKEYKKLIKQIRCLDKSIMQILHTLDEILLDPQKEYIVTVNERTFHFNPPVTQDDIMNMAHERLSLITLLLQDSLNTYSKNIPVHKLDLENIFSPILAFTQGADPKDFQLEKISEEKFENRIDSNGNIVTALPLNMESHYVKSNLNYMKDTHV